jgi:hypothetical protein
MNFEQLFKQISPEEICCNVFDFAGEGFPIKGFPVITAGKDEHCLISRMNIRNRCFFWEVNREETAGK